MKTLTTCALALLLSATTVFAAEKKEGVSISFNSDDDNTRIASRHVAREARVALTTRNGAAVLLLTNDVVAVQLSDSAMAKLHPKDDANFLEELLVAGVRLAVGKAVEYPIAHIRSAEIRDNALVLTNDEGQAVFADIKVDGENVTRSIAASDAARFVNAFRLVKARR